MNKTSTEEDGEQVPGTGEEGGLIEVTASSYALRTSRGRQSHGLCVSSAFRWEKARHKVGMVNKPT